MVRVWDPAGREVQRCKVAPGHLSGLACDADGRTLVVSERTGRIRWREATTLARTRTPVDVGASVLFVAVSPDGGRVLVLTYPPRPPPPNETYPPTNHWALADARTGAVRQGALGPTDTSAAKFSPDGSHIALGDTDGKVALLDGATGELVRPRGPSSPARRTAA